MGCWGTLGRMGEKVCFLCLVFCRFGLGARGAKYLSPLLGGRTKDLSLLPLLWGRNIFRPYKPLPKSQIESSKMNRYNPDRHHRRSIRLKGYDYSQEGLYFITICCQNRAHLFGRIEDHKMVLNAAGKIATECWRAIPEHFPNVVLHGYVIMPNHVHGILEIDPSRGAKNFSPVQDGRANNNSPLPQPKGTSKTIGSIVRGFKIGVTKWMRQNTTIHDVWQRNYYENIIRNDGAYITISDYIANNPANWDSDRFSKK